MKNKKNVYSTKVNKKAGSEPASEMTRKIINPATVIGIEPNEIACYRVAA